MGRRGRLSDRIRTSLGERRSRNNDDAFRELGSRESTVTWEGLLTAVGANRKVGCCLQVSSVPADLSLPLRRGPMPPVDSWLSKLTLRRYHAGS